MRLLGLTLIAALTACEAEPDFDERYEAAEEQIRTKAAEIERDLERNEPEPDNPAS